MSTSTFVEQLYTRFLSRAAEAEGKAYWVRKIDSGELNAAQVTQYFVESAEFAQIMSPVARLYFTAFGRIPDAAGLDFWAQGYRAGASLQRIAGDFVGSDEFKTLYGSAVDDGAFLDLLYQNTFNRAPDAGGKAAWLEAMAKGLSRAEVVLGFSNSEELITTKGDDVQVVVEYMGIVGGTPSQAQLDAALAGVDPVALITKLYASAAYQGEAVPFLTDSGVAVDGYVKGATVSMTISETVNGVTSTRTVTRITDEQGRFDFGDESGFGPLTMTGGTDIATGKAVNGSYTAPAGSTVVNPLTMLIQAVAASGGVSAEEAEARVKSKLGIASSVDLKRYDPVAAATAPDAGAEKVATALQVQAAAAQVNTVMGQAGALLSGAGAATSRDAGADAAVQALAKAFTADTAKVDLTAGATLAQVVKEAASGASASGQAAVTALADKAGEAIANLNQAIGTAATSATGGLEGLTGMVKVQVVAEAVETKLAEAAGTGNIAGVVADTSGDALTAAVETAEVGDVDGDGDSDATASDDDTTTGGTTTGGATMGGTTTGGTTGGTTTGGGATTGGSDGGGSSTPADTTAPTVSITLSDNALKAGETATVTFTFSETPSGFSAADVTVQNGTLSNLAVSSDPLVYTATFTSAADIEDSTNVITVGTVWSDAAGNAPSSSTDSGNYAVDTVAPALSSSSPVDNATAVAAGGNIVLSFSETVVAGSGNIVIANANDSGDTRTIAITDTTQVSFSGSTVTINTTSDLQANGSYSVTLGGGVIKDSAGNAYAGIADAAMLNFHTPVSSIALSSLDGTIGFRLDGAAAGDKAGSSVSAAGDVNGDGFGDLIVGAFQADPNGNSYAGSSYVVFGQASGFASSINLSSLDGTTGFRLDGAAAGDYAGSVSAAGDVNGDGLGDLIVGASSADPNGGSSGASYVVFGKTGGFASSLALSSLDGTTGFRLDGAAAGDYAGSVSAAGDVNGDGLGDLIVGASSPDIS